MTATQSTIWAWLSIIVPAFGLAILGLQFSEFWCAIGAIIGMAVGLVTVFVWKPWAER